MNKNGAIIENKRQGQINALKSEFGTRLPQSFFRPKYKYVHSPLFPPGLKTGPQPYSTFKAFGKLSHSVSIAPIQTLIQS